jgi:hypothetical protein
MGNYAGTEVEARMRYWIKPNRYRIESGAAVLLKGNLLRNAPNARATGDTHYFYLDLTAVF